MSFEIFLFFLRRYCTFHSRYLFRYYTIIRRILLHVHYNDQQIIKRGSSNCKLHLDLFWHPLRRGTERKRLIEGLILSFSFIVPSSLANSRNHACTDTQKSIIHGLKYYTFIWLPIKYTVSFAISTTLSLSHKNLDSIRSWIHLPRRVFVFFFRHVLARARKIIENRTRYYRGGTSRFVSMATVLHRASSRSRLLHVLMARAIILHPDRDNDRVAFRAARRGASCSLSRVNFNYTHE